MSETAMVMARILREMRTRRGLSQSQLAERAGLSENAIGAFERGERFPRASTLDALTDALEMEADVVIGDLLRLRERPASRYQAGDVPPLRALGELLADQPDRVVRLVLLLARVVVEESRLDIGSSTS